MKHKYLNTKDPTILFFYVSVVLCILSAIMLGLALWSVRHPHITTVSPQTPFAINTPVSSGATTITVKSVLYNSGKGRLSAPKGQKFAIVTLAVTNRTDKPINILPTTDTYAKDKAGNVYYMSPASLDAPFRSGELPPGESIQGQLSFAVPETGQLTFYADAIWSGSVVPFKIR